MNAPSFGRRAQFLSFFESATGAAMVTVLLGGALGQFISCDVQNRVRERDFNDAWLKSRGEQALMARGSFSRRGERCSKRGREHQRRSSST
jgi:hypothetical protein